MFGNWEFSIQKHDAMHDVFVYMSRVDADRNIVWLTHNNTFKKTKEIVTMTELEDLYLCRVPEDALQSLADKLASIGYKPEKGKLEGVLEAQTKHLEDMRRIVFDDREPRIEQNIIDERPY